MERTDDKGGGSIWRVSERLGVPRPERGYRAKLAVGKAQDRPTLPEPEPGDALEWSKGDELPLGKRPLPKAPSRPRKQSKKPIRKRDQHPLFLGARELFLKGRTSDNGYLKPSKRLLVDCDISEDTLDHALSTANSLFLALDASGHSVVIAPRDRPYWRPEIDVRTNRATPLDDYYRYRRWYPFRPTVTFIGTVAIGLTIFESRDEVEAQYRDGKYVRASDDQQKKNRYAGYGWTSKRDMPNEKLCLRASSPYPNTHWEKEWPEKAKGHLIKSVDSIVRHLERQAPRIVELVREAEEQAKVDRIKWEERQRRWKMEEHERKQREARAASTKELLEIIDAWNLTKRIEQFLAMLKIKPLR